MNENIQESKKRYRLIFDRKNCIGAGPCAAVSPDSWQLDEQDGRRAHVLGSVASSETEEETMEFGEEHFEEHMNAALSCPVNVIHIHDQEKKKKLI